MQAAVSIRTRFKMVAIYLRTAAARACGRHVTRALVRGKRWGSRALSVPGSLCSLSNSRRMT